MYIRLIVLNAIIIALCLPWISGGICIRSVLLELGIMQKNNYLLRILCMLACELNTYDSFESLYCTNWIGIVKILLYTGWEYIIKVKMGQLASR